MADASHRIESRGRSTTPQGDLRPRLSSVRGQGELRYRIIGVLMRGDTHIADLRAAIEVRGLRTLTVTLERLVADGLAERTDTPATWRLTAAGRRFRTEVGSWLGFAP